MLHGSCSRNDFARSFFRFAHFYQIRTIFLACTTYTLVLRFTRSQFIEDAYDSM